jgi:hypothetical protein
VKDPLISIDECIDQASQDVELSWDLGSSTGSTVELLGSDAAGCAENDSSVTSGVLVDALSTSQTSYPASGDAAITLADVLSAAGRSTSCEGTDFRVYVCVRLLDDSGVEVTTASAAIKLQLSIPPPPKGLSVQSGERALYVSFSPGSATTAAPAGSASYRAFASAGGVTHRSSETTDETARISGLENGTTYDVWVVAYSSAGNESDRSELSAGTPQHVQDFFDGYQVAGGAERGGCGAGGRGGLLALLAAAWACRRLARGRVRRPSRSGTARAVLALAWAATSPSARAESGEGLNELSLRIETYRPAIDAEMGGAAHPYAQAFGSRGLWGGRLEYARTRSFAGNTLGLGLGAGYLAVHGHGSYTDATSGALTRSGDATALHLLPVAAFVTWRLDLLADRWHVPVVPYARASLERYHWITTGTGHASRRGATNGWSFTAGAVLRLDVVDPESARLLSQDDGIRVTGLTFDLTRSYIDDFGSRRSWNLGSKGWAVSGGLLVGF